MFRTTVALSLVVLSFGRAEAQELRSPIALPGSINASIGNPGPVEPNNTVGSVTFEQGVTAWRRGPLFVIGFVDLTVRGDTQDYAWNNTMPFRAGGKFMVAGANGVFQAVVGVAGEARQSASYRPTTAAYVSYWAGWQRSRSRLQLPGSVWATSGLVTAAEPGNWITAGHLDQGVTAWRSGNVSLVPFVGTTLSVDTDHYAWNNRGSFDAGVKVSTRVRGTAIDVGVAQRVTREWETGVTDAAPVAFVNLWVGWMPRLNR